MRYQVILKPETADPATGTVVDENGVVHQTVVVGVLTDGAVAQAAARTNGAKVALAMLENSVQPSQAQVDGLLGYVTLIAAQTATETIETAITNAS